LEVEQDHVAMSDWTICTLVLVGALSASLYGCCKKTVPTERDQPARVIEADAASRLAVQNAVSTALHTDVMLADDALTTTSVLVIERNPPRSLQGHPAQGRIMEAPIQFQLVRHGEACVLIDQRDRSRYPLENTRCKAE
jgi:hypothetical protein